MIFEIPLAEQRIKPHQVTALHLMTGFALIASGAFITVAFMALMIKPFSWEPITEKGDINIHSFLLPEYLLIIAGIIILFAAMFRNKWLLQPRINKAFRIIELILCAVIAGYSVFTGAYVLTGIFGILSLGIIYAFVAEAAKRGPTIIIDDTGIKLPFTSRRRNIKWTETQKVLLRHGALTVNCVDSSLYQWMTASNDINADEFETYCTAEIEAARKHRDKDNW